MSTKKTILILSLIILITTASVQAAAPWNPDGSDLKFRVTFDDNPTSTTTIARDYYYGTPGGDPYTGTLSDYNTVNHVVWRAGGPIGTCADFNHMNDKQLYYWPDPNIHFGGSDPNWGGAPNDCKVKVDPDGGGSPVLRFGNATIKRSWAFWFNDVDCNDPGKPYTWASRGKISYPTLRDSVFIRHQNASDGAMFWDMCIKNSRLQFRNFKEGARMAIETASDLNSLGVKPMTWHHVVFVIDRTTGTSSQIYLDGLAVPVVYGDLPSGNISGNINPYGDPCPLSIGANGTTADPWRLEGDFDGMLDDIRVYHKALSPLEVSILHQTDYGVHPIALLPIPGVDAIPSTEVSIATDVNWIRAAGATSQRLLFGTDPCKWDVNTTTIVYGGSTDVNKVNNTDFNGPLYLNTTYYWRVDSNNCNPGPLWSFHTITGEASPVYPTDGQQKVASGRIDVNWSAPDANNFDVYFDVNESKVDANDPNVRVANHNVVIDADPNWAVSAFTPGKTYYWRVVSFYPYGLSATSEVWSFRAAAYPIVFNTSTPLTCTVRGVTPPGVTGSLDANVAVFNFPSGFDYNECYDIFVEPENTPDNDAAPSAPLVIDVNGNFYFNGTMDISGEITDPSPFADRMASPKARCGGHRGPRKQPLPGINSPDVINPDDGRPTGYYYWHCGQWDDDTCISYIYGKIAFENRYGLQQNHRYYTPTASGYGVFGLGTGLTAPYDVGGGGGYGGKGGDSGRGYYHGIFAGGASYGDKEVPVPFGGSAGSWGQSAPGGAGGGGFEIVADGNVILGNRAKIYAEGGLSPYIVQYPGGGGSGGSVKIVADGNVTIDGLISVNGGKGGDGSEKGNNTGGGGAGGRVAIFYGKNYTKTGTITADGGAKGVVVQSSCYPQHNGLGLARKGDDGTIYEVNSLLVSPRKASAPTPKNGDYLVYAPASSTPLTLKWYSGYNKTDACDTVYCDTSNPPTTQIGNPVPASRGEHNSTATKLINPNMTYYMKVRTVGIGFTPVDSNVWTFKTVGWQCQEPDWPGGGYNPPQYYDPCYPVTDPNMAGWPAWDINHDCVVNDLDFWFFAKDWQVNVSGHTYMLDLTNLEIYTSEWMTCRARTNNGCDGWPLTPDWIRPVIVEIK